jgi:hypothetical protein
MRALAQREMGERLSEETQIDANSGSYIPVRYERCAHVAGPFFHGTKSALEIGDELIPGYGSNFQEGRVSNNIYFTALVGTAAWGAELATALAGSKERDTSTSWNPWVPSRTTPT